MTKKNPISVVKPSFKVWLAFMLFIMFFTSDFLSTLYIIFTSKDNAPVATIVSVGLVALGFYGYREFQRQPWYIVPILIGSALGTYFSIKLF